MILFRESSIPPPFDTFHQPLRLSDQVEQYKQDIGEELPCDTNDVDVEYYTKDEDGNGARTNILIRDETINLRRKEMNYFANETKTPVSWNILSVGFFFQLYPFQVVLII